MDGDTKRLEEAPLRTLRRCDGASENGGGGGGGRRAASGFERAIGGTVADEDRAPAAAAAAASARRGVRPATGGTVAAEPEPAPAARGERVSLMALLERTEQQWAARAAGGHWKRVDAEDEAPAEEKEKEKGGGGGVGGRCCVCVARGKGAAFIPCGHTFCRACARELRAGRGRCPLCNATIREAYPPSPMEMAPAATSASPAVSTSAEDALAPESPAASAKGTVRPSETPMMMSRTTSPAVKCFSEKGGGGGVGGRCCVCVARGKGAAFIPCGHTFCRACARELRAGRGRCPLCNATIREVLNLF
ncbi:E3 ubiquitin-protein ligase TRIM33-like [Panicum hallii]|uniref:E3 ubiquitin-protein ligase TRIM33-like n=1 Tax=Panicum hallii TaxID=206008 RepID=UPI000DF4DECE|nr:E3 ubiquitin-protein ligase TRIM33-like [Panicum hallii]